MSSADPGGGPSNITNLQETFSQQQAKITALKELVRNAEQGKNTANNQEKIRNIAQRLTHIKSKASRSKQSERYYESEEADSNLSYEKSSVSSSVSTTPIQQHARAKSEALGSEKIEILRTQMEENRKKMAEREIVKKGIADIVTQLKAKFDITQMSLEKSSELGKSIGDLSLMSAKGGLNQSTSDLSYTSTNLDKERIRNLQMKCLNLEHKLKEKENFTDSESDQTKKIKELENKILDLEENLREKESVIEARTSAVSLMSESLSLKGKNTVDLLEDTKQEMIKMQNNFIHSENDFKSEIEVLKIQTDEKSSQIQNLEEKIKILEKVRYDLTVKNSELEGRVNESENQKYDIDIISEAEITEMNKDDQVKKIHVLEEEIIKLQQKIKLSDNNLLEKYEELDTRYKKLEAENLELVEKNNSLEELITEKSIEYNVLQANFAVLEEKLNSSAPKSLFSKSTDEVAEAEITKLKIQLDDVNKSGIKMKLKIKQLQKQLDNFKKESNLNNEVVRLTEETQSLQQKIIELEEEKGQLQLKLVHDDSSNLSSDPEMENKLKVLEQTCQNQTSAIQLLEEQKVDLAQDLLATKHELSTLKIQMNEIDQQETSRVSSHYNEIEYEEKLEKLKLEIINLQTVVENANVENQRLLDNIDQLQLERGSSNESIEIVEKLTQQEKQELEDYEKFREKSQSAAEESKAAFVIGDENIALSDSLIKLREESSELLHKIDLFTIERCEVLEKMELLTIENVKLKEKLQEFEDKSTRREDIPLPDETYVTNIQQLETEIENIKKNKDKTLKSKTKKLLQESQKICELTKMLVNDHKLMLAETSEIRVELKYVKEKYKELQEVSHTKGQEEIERLNSLLLEAKNIEDDRESLDVQLKKSKNRISENDSTIKDLNNEIKTLKNENENVLVRLENMKLENAHYENKVTTLSSDIAVLEVDNERLKNTLKEIEVQIEDYQTRFKSSNEQMEILKTLVSEQKQQLIDTLTEHEQENQQNHDTIESLKGKLARNNDNDNLKSMLNQQEEDLHYKQETIDALNKQIIDLYATMEETTNQMTKQQNDLQDDFDHKLSQIDQLNKEIKQLTHKLNENNKLQTEMSLEIKDLKNKLNENQKQESNDNRVNELEKTVNDMENKNKEQLDKLKKYAANLKKKVAQCTELEEKLAKAKASNEITHELELKVQYVTTLEQEITLLRGELNKTTVNLQQSQNSQSEIKELLAEINNLQLEITNQNQINSDQNKIIEDLKLDLSRRERALDMFEVDVDSMNNQIHEKAAQIENYMAELENLKKDHKTLAEDVVSKNIKIDKCKAIIKEKNKEIQKLNNSIENLNVKIEHLQQKVEIYEDQEKDHSEQKIIERLNAKVQENLLYIETIEMENSQFKEKVYKLEDGIRNIEDRRLSLERHASTLDNELKEKTNEFSENEDLLVQRLTALSQHDEIMEKRLKEVQNENIEIGEILKETKFEKEELNRKLHHLQNHISFLEESKIHDLEKINNDLSQQVEIQKTEMKRMHSEFEKKMYDSKIEIDEMEQNYTITIDGIQKDKKEIEQFNEKLRDENNYIQNEILQLRETNNSLELQKEDLDKELCYIKIQYENNQMEIRELTVKISEKQNEIEHLRQQNQAIAQNYDIEVNSLKTQLADLDSMNTQVGQNQTDDQAMLQQENTKLRELLVEKENEIERYNQPIDLSARNAELQETIRRLEEIIELKENEFKSVRQSLVRQTSHQEIDSVLSAAEDCVQQIQKSPVLKSFNWEDLTQSRQKYEIDIKNYTKTIENLESEIENLKIYTHDLEERFKNVHVIREESLRKLAEKTQLYEELLEINKNLERQLSLQQHQQPSNTMIQQVQDAVPSFDSSIFFGQSQSGTPFDDEVQVKSVKSVQSAAVPFVPDTNIADMKLKFEREIQYLIEERDNLQRQLNEIRHLNEKCVKQNNELENKHAQSSSSILTNFFDSTPTDVTDNIFANFSSAGEVHAAQAVEDVIFSKKAYLCGPSEQEVKFRKTEAEKTPTESMEILFDDQSWGWEAEPQSLDSFSMQNSNLAYEKIIDEIKIENRELQFLLNDWKTKFNNMSLQNLEINSSCIKNQEEILNLKSQLEMLTDENAENLTQLGQCNYQLQELNQLNSTYSEKIVKLELIISNNSEKLTQLEEYRSRCDELNTLNLANKCEIKKLEDLNAKHSFENGNQLKQIKHNEELIGEYQNRIEQLQQTVQTNIDLHTKYEEISSSNIAYQNQVKQLEESIQNYSQLHQQLHQYQQEVERLNQLICEYQNRVKELDEFTHGTAEAAHQQSIQIVELNNTNSEYKKEIERLNEIIREKENQMVSPQQELIVESPQSNITPFDSTAFFNQGSSFDFFNVQNEPFLGQENQDKQPIIEEVIVPKQAYVCGTIDDDGWGFDTSNEVVTEQLQKSSANTTQSLIPANVQSQIEIQEYQDNIQELELEKSRMGEEIVQLKIKSGKLIKKLKEYKNEMDKPGFKKSSSIDSTSDLDLAIQEELNIQIKKLEERLKESKSDFAKHTLEKQNLNKQIDVLTSANDRMTEMKERQDQDIKNYQHKVKELNEKLHQLEQWDDENYNKDTPTKVMEANQSTDVKVLENSIKLLKAEINDLKIDNDELQAILDEEKSNNKINESKLKQIEESSNEMLEKIKTLEINLKGSLEENSSLKNEIERMKTASLFQSPEFSISSAARPQFIDSNRINELETEIQNLTGQLQYKDSEILHLNQKISDIIKEDQTQSLVQEILTKNYEINVLKQQVQTLTQDREELENNLSVQITHEEMLKLNKELQTKTDEIVGLKQEKHDMENELKILNDQVIASLQFEDKMKSVALELDCKNIEINELKNSLAQLSPGGQYITPPQYQQKRVQSAQEAPVKETFIKDEDTFYNDKDTITKMQDALESQEIEIVTLKEQLAIRSAEYARLASQLDPFGQYSSSSIKITSNNTKLGDQRKVSSSSSNREDMTMNEVIPRAELDLALYMLHQRDMRCEELTLELVHLLEERDTLQLKLSNSLRQTEEIRRKAGISEISDSEPNVLNTSKFLDSTEMELDVTKCDTNTSLDTTQMKSKLTELHGIDHARDKRLQEDRENRHRQMTQLQKDISNIPSEAVAHLVGADYTLSRTSQSPSSVLFNWLMGKSTPRAPPS